MIGWKTYKKVRRYHQLHASYYGMALRCVAYYGYRFTVIQYNVLNTGTGEQTDFFKCDLNKRVQQDRLEQRWIDVLQKTGIDRDKLRTGLNFPCCVRPMYRSEIP